MLSIRTLYLSLIFVCVFSFGYTRDDFLVENQPMAIEQMMQLEQIGTLKQKENGFLYLDVSNEFISTVLPLIEVSGKIKPTGHYTSKKGMGAHISVIYESEIIKNEIWEIAEIGQQYAFIVKDIRTIKVRTQNGTKKLWIIAVSCPELEILRDQYGLKPLLQGHDFHITIGNQIPVKKDLPVQLDQDGLDNEYLRQAA